MKRLSIFLILATVMYSISSCQNETEELFQSATSSELGNSLSPDSFEEKFILKGSYLEFKDSESFFDVFNSSISDNDIIQGTPSNNFNSLKSKYKSIEESYVPISQSETKSNDGTEYEFDDAQIIENRVGSFTLTELLNTDGVIKIGESIYKFDGNYAYIITNGNENSLKRLLAGEEHSSLENVSYEQVIFPLLEEGKTMTKGSSGGQYDRSPVFKPTNDGDRREYVKFNAYLFKVPNAQTEIVVEIEGRAQKKKILGIWGTTFSDEMLWAEIHVNSGSWYYNQPPAGGFPTSQGTNYFITGLRANNQNSKTCKWAQKLGNSGGVSAVKANITFKAKKNSNQPSDWAGVYTNNYTSITD